MAAANKVGRIVKISQNLSVLHVTQKHKSCPQSESPVIQVGIVKPFQRPSALLHLFGRASGRGAVSHRWVVNVHCVTPDHYASSENERYNKVQPKYVFVLSK